MTKKIDILIMGDNCLETVGGEQESTKIIIEDLKDIYSIGVIQPGILKCKKENVQYFELSDETRIKHIIKKPVLLTSYLLNTLKIIRKSKPQIIHTQAQISFFIVSLFKKIGLISSNIVLIHTERGLYTKYNKFIRCLFLFFMKELDFLVTTTNFNMSYWRKALLKKKYTVKKIVIENTAGKTFEKFNNELVPISDTNNFTIGFAGRYADWKNWPLAIKISKELYKDLGEKLSVSMAVGCLDDKSKKETKIMFNKMKSMFGEKFEGHININLDEMDKFYYQIDAFILTSNYNTESFGRTLVEAMSRYNIVLTTNAGGSVEVVGNNSNVCHSVEDFTSRIKYFINNEQELVNEKKANLMRVKDVYSHKNNISKHINMYDRIIK